MSYPHKPTPMIGGNTGWTYCAVCGMKCWNAPRKIEVKEPNAGQAFILENGRFVCDHGDFAELYIEDNSFSHDWNDGGYEYWLEVYCLYGCDDVTEEQELAVLEGDIDPAERAYDKLTKAFGG